MPAVAALLAAACLLAGCGTSADPVSEGETASSAEAAGLEESAGRIEEAHAAADCERASREATAFVELLDRDDVAADERQTRIDALLQHVGEDCENATFALREALP